MRRFAAALVFGLAVLTSCATPNDQRVAYAASPEATHRLFFIGLALYNEKWSENDVAELADTLRASTPYRVVPLIASNVASKPRGYPIATDTVIAEIVRTTASQTTQDDIVFVVVSTHGARGALARQIGNAPPTALSGVELARELAPLAGRPTVILISACYSGSLIPALRTPGRIIITAARADRSSFGCSPNSRHTYFGEAELHSFSQPGQTLQQIVATMREEVARREQESDYKPSEPQVWVSPDAMALYQAPIF